MQIAIATTDFDPCQTETVTITAVNGSVLAFRPKLKYSHFAPGVPTGINGVTMPMVRTFHCTLADHSCSAAPLRSPAFGCL